ncbi:pre-mRNA-splicing factor 38B isoform X2 [Manduca sexta]|uniref:pre-mRNA-splicing factor 38B isoform X2 n=1 Tax=Manduca sexta TaxID=7130 RepID=UPI0018905928|nr:pre-mRNA-splicing factor 38B isoform X2 [Manduca sexta]
MGKDKKRKRDMINELSERLMELEKRMRRRHSDDYETSPSSQGSRHRERSESRHRQRSESHHRQRSESRQRETSESHHRERSESCQQHQTSIIPDTIQQTLGDPPLPSNIEELLGEEGTPSANNAISIHDGLSRRWTTIIQNGLKEDTKYKL